MVLPIVAYGAEVLRKQAAEIDAGYTGLTELITNMWETMEASNGVGLAAPQINRDIRLFVVDSSIVFANLDEEDEGKYPDAPGIRQVFINAQIESLNGEPWPYNEGCLSIPKIREDVTRPSSVTMRYQDEEFNTHTQTFYGVTGRIIMHEYDHIEGKLFIDYLSPLKRRLLKGKLDDISKGRVKTDYRMIFSK
jgi:peptide deformylase